MNPIEQVWSWMKEYVEKKKPETKAQLKLYIEEAWENMTTDLINKYINHLQH